MKYNLDDEKNVTQMALQAIRKVRHLAKNKKWSDSLIQAYLEQSPYKYGEFVVNTAFVLDDNSEISKTETDGYDDDALWQESSDVHVGCKGIKPFDIERDIQKILIFSHRNNLVTEYRALGVLDKPVKIGFSIHLVEPEKKLFVGQLYCDGYLVSASLPNFYYRIGHEIFGLGTKSERATGES